MKSPTKALSASARAQWLGELAIAIDEAQWLAWRLGVVEGDNAEALELYVRLEIARAEVEALQGRRPTPPEAGLRPPRNPPSSGRPEEPRIPPSQRTRD